MANPFHSRIKRQKPPSGYTYQLEALYRHLLKSPFHDLLQKVKGYVFG
jgi:hypothetical protein